MVQEIKKLLSYDKRVVNGHGTTILPALLENDSWKEQVAIKGFDLAFKDHPGNLHDIARTCCRFEFPIAARKIPVGLKCPECHCTTENMAAILCCHDDRGIPGSLF